MRNNNCAGLYKGLKWKAYIRGLEMLPSERQNRIDLCFGPSLPLSFGVVAVAVVSFVLCFFVGGGGGGPFWVCV